MAKSLARGRAALLQQMGLLTDEQLCVLLKISPATLRNRRSTGTAPASSKVGNEHLTKVSDVETFMQRKRVDNSARAPHYREVNAARTRRQAAEKATA
jgi:hypothetical protein